MQILRNTYAEHMLMPHFGGGEKANVETGGLAFGWAATESAGIGAAERPMADAKLKTLPRGAEHCRSKILLYLRIL